MREHKYPPVMLMGLAALGSLSVGLGPWSDAANPSKITGGLR